MFAVISEDDSKSFTLPLNNSITSTTATVDWYYGTLFREPTVFIETEPIPRQKKKKKIPNESWRAKRKRGPGIR